MIILHLQTFGGAVSIDDENVDDITCLLVITELTAKLSDCFVKLTSPFST